jgi:hypothetical protein
MPSFEVEFEVYCSSCSAGLCNQSQTFSKGGCLSVEVEPCEKCLEAVKEEAHNEGYDEGYEARQEEEN